jgi:2-dehydro-3-deoxygalactonokinase
MNKFLSCDWGTSSFRLRLVDTGIGKIYGETVSDMGISETWQEWISAKKPESERVQFYKSKLEIAIGQMPVLIEPDTPLILSGMASSSIGLAELPHQKFPFHWDLEQLLVQKLDADDTCKHAIYLVSGFRTDDDIMRGEETMLLGFNPTDDDEKIFIFPGTHSKHVRVTQKAAVDISTYMTGELFKLLTEKSILRTAVSMGNDEKSFAEGFFEGLEGNLLHKVFKVRTRQLLNQTDPVSNFQWLSGLLIGEELRELTGGNCPVYLVSSEHFKESYLNALHLLDKNRTIVYQPENDMLINGHCKIAAHYF